MPVYAPDGSLYISETDLKDGSLFIKIVAGSLAPTNSELREDGDFELREDSGMELRE